MCCEWEEKERTWCIRRQIEGKVRKKENGYGVWKRKQNGIKSDCDMWDSGHYTFFFCFPLSLPHFLAKLKYHLFSFFLPHSPSLFPPSSSIPTTLPPSFPPSSSIFLIPLPYLLPSFPSFLGQGMAGRRRNRKATHWTTLFVSNKLLSTFRETKWRGTVVCWSVLWSKV